MKCQSTIAAQSFGATEIVDTVGRQKKVSQALTYFFAEVAAPRRPAHFVLQQVVIDIGSGRRRKMCDAAFQSSILINLLLLHLSHSMFSHQILHQNTTCGL